jgi:putative ABC transport system substrate-binding protein
MPAIIGRRELIAALGGAAVWPVPARAQVSERKYTIGVLTAGSEHAVVPVNAAFYEALQELGWVEGKNVVFERRFAENRLERLPELAADLVRRKVDVIAAAGTLAPLAAKRATTTIPIVMMAAGDPLGSGLVASLARPGAVLKNFIRQPEKTFSTVSARNRHAVVVAVCLLSGAKQTSRR